MLNTIAPDSRHVVEACAFLIDSGFCGLAWLDADLVVRERAGSLVDFVPLDTPVGTALLPLFGCEDDIRALRHDPGRRLELANVRIIGERGDGPRLSFTIYWLETSARYLIILMRATVQSELEAELENQSRRRALAEAQYIEKSKAYETANAELTRANRDLDEIANVIAHDLKSPMRAVRYVADDIEKALAGEDHEAAKALLADLKQQALRMSCMLTDLLAYARIGPDGEEAVRETDTRALIDSIIASLPRPRGFLVETAGTWPAMRTVEAALDLVLRNLIDNAIRHHDRPDGKVTLDARPVREGVEIMVWDDGPGIEPRYHAAIFQPFRKLEPRPSGEAGGSGIGLSLVRKTVEANRATLTLESAPGVRRGTTFRLFWPGKVAG